MQNFKLRSGLPNVKPVLVHIWLVWDETSCGTGLKWSTNQKVPLRDQFQRLAIPGKAIVSLQNSSPSAMAVAGKLGFVLDNMKVKTHRTLVGD